jgi:opacity protein-like surface antigen
VVTPILTLLRHFKATNSVTISHTRNLFNNVAGSVGGEVKTLSIIKTLVVSLSLFALIAPQRAHAQLIPQPWVSVGSQDGDVTYSVGARAFDFGAELGFGPDGSTGVDVLRFVSLPIISPYVGVGYYSADKGLAVSGGVQVGATENIFLGVGYNTVRGINGQLGIRF